VRGFVFGLLLLIFLTITLLSLRPGGLRRQLRFAARRFRVALVLGGIYLAVTIVIRLFFPDGLIAEWGPPAAALVLAVAFIVLSQDPAGEKH
jgi:hypothetical protein